VIEAGHLVKAAAEPRVLSVPGEAAYGLATDEGVFEPAQALGETVQAGTIAGRIHFLTDPGREPVILRHRVDGIVFAKRQPGRVKPGNCCFVVAVPYDWSGTP
jgi:predicted deacylase